MLRGVVRDARGGALRGTACLLADVQLPLQLLGSAALLQLARSNVDSSLVTVGADTYGGHGVILSGQCVTVLRSNVYIPIIQQDESD